MRIQEFLDMIAPSVIKFEVCEEKEKERFQMEKKEIYEMVISELSERALAERRKNCCEEERERYKRITELAEQRKQILEKLSPEEREIVEEHFSQTELMAYHESEYLYEQGAKDCIELLKKLGVL